MLFLTDRIKNDVTTDYRRLEMKRADNLLFACAIFLSVTLAHLSASAQSTKSLSDFGVVADGQHDETRSIQSAIDSGDCDLSFAKGTYRLTNTLVIDLDKVGHTSIHGRGAAKFIMEGEGPAFRFIGTHDGTAAPKTVKPNVWQRQNTPLVDGIQIEGAHPLADGIEASGTMQITISRVTVHKTRHAIRLIKRNRNVTLSECHLYDNSGIGVYLDGVNLHQINIGNCHISYNDGGGIVAKKSELRNLQIGTCDIEGNMGDEKSPPSANVWIDAAETSIGEVAIVGCTIQHAHNAPDSANIRINGLSTKRPFTDELRHGNITIADNVLSDVQVNIQLDGVRAAAISGNTIWKGYERNLLFTNCKNIVMTGNILDRNPRYHYGDGAQAKLGVQFKDCQDCTISGNQSYGKVLHDAAFEVIGCRRFNVSGLTLLDYGDVGLYIKDTVDSQVTGCLIREDAKDAEGKSVLTVDVKNVTFSGMQVSHP